MRLNFILAIRQLNIFHVFRKYSGIRLFHRKANSQKQIKLLSRRNRISFKMFRLKPIHAFLLIFCLFTILFVFAECKSNYKVVAKDLNCWYNDKIVSSTDCKFVPVKSEYIWNMDVQFFSNYTLDNLYVNIVSSSPKWKRKRIEAYLFIVNRFSLDFYRCWLVFFINRQAPRNTKLLLDEMAFEWIFAIILM